jgi:hypothetical protein
MIKRSNAMQLKLNLTQDIKEREGVRVLKSLAMRKD